MVPRSFSGRDACDRSYSFEFCKNILYLLISFGTFVVSDSLFDVHADVSHWGLVFSVHIFSLSDEGQELLVFAVDRFFFARCRYSCVLLRCFTSQLISWGFQRCRVLLLFKSSVSSFAAAVVIVSCCNSSISASSYAAAIVVVVLLIKYFRLLVCRCFMFASEPLFKFITSSLDFLCFLMSRGASRVSCTLVEILFLIWVLQFCFVF